MFSFSCCDSDCAVVNNCMVGGMVCDKCGGRFCRTELANHDGRLLCDNCEEGENEDE